MVMFYVQHIKLEVPVGKPDTLLICRQKMIGKRKKQHKSSIIYPVKLERQK
jgi:hypothetical protein